MGASEDEYGAALALACSLVRLHPKIAHWAEHGDPEDHELLATFRTREAVKRYLSCSSPGRRDELLVDLLTKAQAYVHEGGEGDRVLALFVQQRDAGLGHLSSHRRAVHRAVLSLALHRGTPVLASMRYLAVVVAAQSGIEVSPPTLRRDLIALSSQGLVTYVPGRRGLKAQSGRILLGLLDPLDHVDVDAVSELSLAPEVLIALDHYRRKARHSVSARSDAAHAVHTAARAKRIAWEGRLTEMLWEADVRSVASRPDGELAAIMRSIERVQVVSP